MKIKICGITRVEDALLAESLGADFIGLIFAAQSKRAVTLAKAQEIVAPLKKTKVIGVFVDESERTIAKIAKQLSLYAVQYYHKRHLAIEGVKTIGACLVQCQEDMAEISTIGADYVLVEAGSRQHFGGIGLSFDWSWLPENKQNLILAGGIQVGNIDQALSTGVYALDICSGVEQSPGVKDKQKLQAILSRRAAC